MLGIVCRAMELALKGVSAALGEDGRYLATRVRVSGSMWLAEHRPLVRVRSHLLRGYFGTHAARRAHRETCLLVCSNKY